MTPTIRQIQEKTCDIWGITLEQLLSRSRTAEVKTPRHLGMVYAASVGYLTSQISRAYVRCYSNVLYAINTPREFHYEKIDIERYAKLCQSFAIDPEEANRRLLRLEMLSHFQIA